MRRSGLAGRWEGQVWSLTSHPSADAEEAGDGCAMVKKVSPYGRALIRN